MATAVPVWNGASLLPGGVVGAGVTVVARGVTVAESGVVVSISPDVVFVSKNKKFTYIFITYSNIHVNSKNKNLQECLHTVI